MFGFFKKKDEKLQPEETSSQNEQQQAEDNSLESPLQDEPIVGEMLLQEETTLEESLEEETILEEENHKQETITPKKEGGLFQKMWLGLDKTRKNILGQVDNVLKAFVKIDESLFEELEEALILADVGANTSVKIIDLLRLRVKKENAKDATLVKQWLVDIMSDMLGADQPFVLPSPSVVLVIGVNGVGKTTTIGKLAHFYKQEGRSVLLAAGDTFRAAAIDQLMVWGERSGVTVIAHQENSDPAAVVFDGISAAKARKSDILICDTAGRLHNKKNLMEELRKIVKIVNREYEQAHIEVLLVLDATSGQNALQQAMIFKETANITGVVLTKLDGTAKGGIVLAINQELGVPVRFVGVGEGVSDLQPFHAQSFASALFSEKE